MQNKNLDFSYLKDLAKDDKSFDKITSYIQDIIISCGENEVIDQLKSGFDNFFWYIKNAETNEFIFYSDSVEDITGYSYAELIKMPGGLLSLIHDDDLQRVKHIFANLAKEPSDESFVFDYRSITKDERVLWFRSTLKAVKDDSGKVINYKGVTYEITKFKDREIELAEEKNKLVELNSAKDRFISIVSHDLRTPFTSLLGFSEILLNDPELTEHERNEYLEYIHDASKTQLQMINYLLDWSKLQTGKLNIDPTRVHLKSLITNCVSVLTGALIRKNLEIITDIPKDIYVNADERLISQTITNLLSNAIKFTPSGKKIYVDAEVFKQGMIEIIVKDEGIGISEENQSRLFKIDQKFSLEGTNGEKGSGLGLTLVKEIIEKHSGNIWFYSQEKAGSEFHITLPEAKNLIIIVDDNPEQMKKVLETIKHSFSSYEILTALNGYEAISFLIDKVPSIILSEHNLPLMNGIQLVEAIRKKFRDVQIPVVIYSSNISEEIKKKYEELSVEQFLTKPLNNKLLIETIENNII